MLSRLSRTRFPGSLLWTRPSIRSSIQTPAVSIVATPLRKVTMATKNGGHATNSNGIKPNNWNTESPISAFDFRSKACHHTHLKKPVRTQKD